VIAAQSLVDDFEIVPKTQRHNEEAWFQRTCPLRSTVQRGKVALDTAVLVVDAELAAGKTAVVL
jgi:hypothetical protein